LSEAEPEGTSRRSNEHVALLVILNVINDILPKEKNEVLDMPAISRRKQKPTLRTRTLPSLPETRSLKPGIPARNSKPKPLSKKSIDSNTKSTTKTYLRKNGSNDGEKKSNQARKRYRRVKVLRWWVFPAIFFVPLGILLIEYYVGKLISIDDVKDIYYKQLGMDPWDLESSSFPAERVGAPLSILNVTYTSSKLPQCSDGRRRMLNLHNPKSHSINNRLIPMVIHQHAKTRCLTRNLYK
jgi:hypothetical protein